MKSNNMGKKKTDIIPIQNEEEIVEEIEYVEEVDSSDSLIEEEVKRYSAQVDEMLLTLEATRLLDIDDVEDRLKSAKIKMDIQLKVPQLLNELNKLRTTLQERASIKGNKELSPMDEGLI